MILIQNNPNKSLTLKIEKQKNPLSLTLIPKNKPNNNKTINFIDIEPKIIPLPNKYKIIHQYKPFNTIIETTNKT